MSFLASCTDEERQAFRQYTIDTFVRTSYPDWKEKPHSDASTIIGDIDLFGRIEERNKFFDQRRYFLKQASLHNRADYS
jgi:hypothetical protein